MIANFRMASDGGIAAIAGMRDMEAGMAQARMNIRQLLESRVRQHPEKAFLICEDQVTSYADFDTTVNRVASGFLRLAISAGDRVCVTNPGLKAGALSLP